MSDHKEIKDVVIIGDGEFADIAYDYFTNDSDCNIVAFAVEKNFYTKKTFNDKPVIYVEDLEDNYPSASFMVFVAVTSTKLNRIRRRLYLDCKRKGYKFASYVSSNAFFWRNAIIGENTFIFEGNVIQSNVVIGDNCILWSGNHVGHRSVIKNHVFISSHAVISGYCIIEDNCFVGVNSTFADNVVVKANCVIGAGAIILKNTEENSIYPATSTAPSKVKSFQFYKIKE